LSGEKKPNQINISHDPPSNAASPPLDESKYITDKKTQNKAKQSPSQPPKLTSYMFLVGKSLFPCT
jgi:hypothetical protein